MRVSYDLREEDLVEVQAQLILLRRERLKSSPLFVVALVLLAAPVLWVLRASFWRSPDVLAGTLPGLLDFAVGLTCAGAAVYLALPLIARVPSSRRFDAWSARRMARASARRSLFGPVTLALDEAGLVRTNASGELRLAWSRVKDLLFTERMLTLRLDDGGRVLAVPSRALADAAAFHAAREQVERLSGKRSVIIDLERGTCAVAGPAAPPRRARPALWVALGLAALLLARDRVLRACYDPRASNPEGNVVVYSTAWCPVCARLRDCLQRSHVPFEERDVDLSARAEAEWAQLDGTGVPVTLVGQQVLYGFDPEELKTALAQAGQKLDCDAPRAAP
jgi:mycoredoxin